MTGDYGHHRLRGGSWTSVADELRSANRARAATDARYSIIGSRVGRTLDR
jgi:formylglycine-generating enzyme required for sulfatase activity